jgi:hypothetical protein
MRKAVTVFLGLVVVLCGAMLTAQAEEKKADKAKTIKGTMVCGKCTLGVCKKCTNVLQVKEGDKEVEYFIEDKGKGEKYHKAVCPPNSKQDAEVTGTVSTKDGKKWIKPEKGGVKILK